MWEGVGRELKVDAVRPQAVDAVAAAAYIVHIEVEVVKVILIMGGVEVVNLVFVRGRVEVTGAVRC